MNLSPTQQIRQKLYHSRETLAQQIKTWQAAGEKVVFTNGCFDIIHPGHIDYLAKAAGLGNRLVIAVNTDRSVQALKGKSRPIQSENSRMVILAALGFTNALILFDEDTPAELLGLLLPDIMVKGADYKIHQVAGADIVIKNGGSVVLLPYLEGYSTSAIERKIREGA